MNITDVLDAVFDREVGWRPVSGNLKPVHIANGLFRSLLRVRYNVLGTVAFLRPDNGDERRSYEYMVQKTGDARFAAFADTARKANFERLREYARGLLDADGGVFPSADNSCLSLTCRELISTAPNDRKVGAFAAGLLKGKDGKGKLAQLVRKWLPANEEAPGDPLTALAWPLLSHEPELLDADEPTALRQSAKAKAIVAQLEASATRLADHEASNQNRLKALERAVHFTVLGMLAHAQALAAGGNLEKRSPLLLTAHAEKGSALARASEESLILLFTGFEDFLVDELRDRLERKQPVRYGNRRNENESLELPAQRRDSVAKFFKQIGGYRNAKVTDKLLQERLECWQRVCQVRGKDNAALVMAQTLVECYLAENKGGNPTDFLRGVGRRTGLIYPHFEGRGAQKRIRPSVEILEVLVKACTPVSPAVSDREFLDQLWNIFGFVTGGRPDDALLLEDVGVQVSFEELNSNWDSLVTRLSKIGLARRYPDNISYIGRFHG